uniref:B30.2/SPRY domain-containing protein n=1 Tax=Erpetoichthys calabaricus TaxID=27687 RepID=A0A8C4SS18_ERPCA
MAEAQLCVSQDEFTCSVCQDSLTDSVTIPCGHSFCLKCLTDCWDQSQECRDALKHHKLIFCKTDDSCICMMCVVTEHNGHKMVELETEREEKQVSDSVLREVEENEKREMEKAEGVMEQLEKEIEELKRREAELKELSETKDHLQFLQVRVTLHRESDLTGVPVTHSQISSFVFFSLLSDFCPLTLDINTAHRVLRLSKRNKKVTSEGTVTEYPDHPERFECWPQVLCTEALTGTRCYWEVECTGDFMRIGVAYKGLSRKGASLECGLGNNDKSWCLLWYNSQYSVLHNNKETAISAPYSPRISVYLDWPAGSLSFYSVSHTMTLLQRFNTSFTEPLYPGFYVGPDCSVTISHLTPCDN